MIKKPITLIIPLMIIFIVSVSLTACDNAPKQSQVTEKKLVKDYQTSTLDDIKDAYTVEAFIEKEPPPKEIDSDVNSIRWQLRRDSNTQKYR